MAESCYPQRFYWFQPPTLLGVQVPSGKVAGFSSLLLSLSVAPTSKRRLEELVEEGRTRSPGLPDLAPFSLKRFKGSICCLCVHIPCLVPLTGRAHMGFFPHPEATSELLAFTAPSLRTLAGAEGVATGPAPLYFLQADSSP